VVTIHDACPAFSTKIFDSADELERLNIKFNIALIPFFNEKKDLPRFPEFVDKIKSYKNCQIVLHGLYHEMKNGQFDNFHTTKEGEAEEQIRAGLDIFHEVGINTNVFIPPAWKLTAELYTVFINCINVFGENEPWIVKTSYLTCNSST
jgi:predicted deacetylase